MQFIDFKNGPKHDWIFGPLKHCNIKILEVENNFEIGFEEDQFLVVFGLLN